MAVINKSLSQTARDLGVSLGALLAANPQLRDPDKIRAGTQLNVPGRRKVSARENARQMSRIFSISSTGVAGGPTNAQVAAGGATTLPSQARPLGGGGIQLGRGDTSGDVTKEQLDANAQARAEALAAGFRGFDPTAGARARSAAVSARDPGAGAAARSAAINAQDRGQTKDPRSRRFDRPVGLGVDFTRGFAGQFLGVTPAAQTLSAVRSFIDQASPFFADAAQERAEPAEFSTALRAEEDLQALVGSLGETLDSDLLRNLEDTLGRRSQPFSTSAGGSRSASQTTTDRNDNPILYREFVRDPDTGELTIKKLWRQQDLEEHLRTPQDVVISRSLDGSLLDPDNPAERGLNSGVLGLTKADIAYTANMTGKTLLEARRQNNDALKPNMVAVESADALKGMSEILTGIAEPMSQQDMMTELGYILVGDFWILDPAAGGGQASFFGGNPGFRPGGGGTGTGRPSYPSGSAGSPRAWNWHIGITI